MIDFISIYSELPLSLCLILLERQHVREASAESMYNIHESVSFERKTRTARLHLFFLPLRPFARHPSLTGARCAPYKNLRVLRDLRGEKSVSPWRPLRSLREIFRISVVVRSGVTHFWLKPRLISTLPEKVKRVKNRMSTTPSAAAAG